jgi:hypothetical protein
MKTRQVRTKVVVSLLALVGLLGFSPFAMAEDPVPFPDANLKAAVESALGISDPTPTDMLSLTHLIAQDNGIVDLTGIEHATNLTYLRLHDNQISNILPLLGLTNLTLLFLHDNQISNILPIVGMTNLTFLSLHFNPLDGEAYCIYLPLIEANNPGIRLIYDPNPNPDACDTLGDLDCDDNFTGTDVLIQSSLVVDLIQCTDLPFCISICPDDLLAASDWDCSGSIDGTDVLIGSSIIVDIITEEDTPLGQGCPPEE